MTTENVAPGPEGSMVLKVLNERIARLDEILERFTSRQDFDDFYQRLTRWDDRTATLLNEYFGPQEEDKFSIMARGYLHAHRNDALAGHLARRRSFLEALRDDIKENPPSPKGDVSVHPRGPESGQVVEEDQSRTVFIVHGHDEANLARLERILRNRWRLEPVVLKGEAGRGRTIIEKFEEEAPKAIYAIALLTPDDLVAQEEGEYPQARPNVVFELGWFYGKLGRARVCILSRRGTRLHSDLDGINRIEFIESVEETVIPLERELQAAGLVS